MKSTFNVTLMAMICAIAFSSTNAYASFNKKANPPDHRILKAAHQDFPQAVKISWMKNGEKHIARFFSHNRKITATYSSGGKLLSTLIYSNAEQIPFEMQISIAKKYPGYVIQCMKELITKNKSNYYFLLKYQQGEKMKWLSIKSDGRGYFKVLQRLNQPV